MPPQLSTYQQAASSIYEPQKQAEQIQLTATRDTTKNALEAQKGQVQTNYTQAVQNLQNALEDQTGQINQLYSQRLGGNFSGLQGNDMGKMFARTNQAQGIIESTRANKINEITTGETNADINYGAGVAALTPKYQSLETQYAQNAYGSAVKDYNDYQQQQRTYALSVARLNETMRHNYATEGAASMRAPSKEDLISNIRTHLNSVKGGDNHVAPGALADAYNAFASAGYNPKEFWNYFQGYWNPKQGNYGTQFYGAVGR